MLNLFDLVVVALAVTAALAGYRLGFVTRVASWVGLVLGLLVAVWVLPLLLDQVDPSQHTREALIALSLIFLGAFVGQAVGFVVGSRLRPRAASETLNTADRIAGVGAGIVGLAFVVWLLVPILGHSSGWVGEEVADSWTAAQFETRLPEPPDAVQAFKSIVGEDRFPEVFAALEPTPDLGPPPAASGLSDATAASVAASVVRVEGTACRRIQNGTGFVVADDLIATNAHVVAGEPTTDIIRDDGERFDGVVVTFDPDQDLALVEVSGFDRPPLPLGTAARGARGGAFGHPGGGPLRIAPYEVAREVAATGRTIYGNGLTERQVLELSAALAPGDSGSPLVEPGGAVVGVVFAIARDAPNVGYALTTAELQHVLAEPRVAGADTGPCIAA